MPLTPNFELLAFEPHPFDLVTKHLKAKTTKEESTYHRCTSFLCNWLWYSHTQIGSNPHGQSPRCMHGRLIHWFSITRQYSSTPGAFCFRAKPAMSAFSPLITRSWKTTNIMCVGGGGVLFKGDTSRLSDFVKHCYPLQCGKLQ